MYPTVNGFGPYLFKSCIFDLVNPETINGVLVQLDDA